MKNVARMLAALALSILPTLAMAETIDVYDDHGGSVSEYDAKWTALGQQGASVRITGPCQSACTVLLGRIPRSRICVMPDARFGFHLAHRVDAQQTLWGAYAPDIRAWINAHGGLKPDFMWMGAPDIFHYFKKC